MAVRALRPKVLVLADPEEQQKGSYDLHDDFILARVTLCLAGNNGRKAGANRVDEAANPPPAKTRNLTKKAKSDKPSAGKAAKIRV